MERFNFVKNGVLRLPPGFRFHPTDQELVIQYLRRKVYDCPLPTSIIPESDVCHSDPWDLPGDCDQERYFFSTKEAKYPNGNRANRATISGYWKATGIDKPVLAGNKNINQVVGMKKTLVFYRGKPPRGSKTDWIMHEYRLAAAADNIPTQDLNARGNWVLCRIFLKRRSDGPMIDTFRINSNVSRSHHHNNLNANDDGQHNRGNRVRNHRPIFYDFMGCGSDDKSRCPGVDVRKMAGSNTVVQATSPSSSGSSGSSGVTDVSDREEGSSCGNGFPYFSGKSI